MKSKIKSISFENFKLFSEEKKVSIPTDSLFILDGPNGYGKTTVFDAIEILIKGERNREESLDTTYRAKNRTLPFANDKNKKIIITGIFEVNGEERCYLREFEANSNKGGHQNIKQASQLYRIENNKKHQINPEEMYQELGLNEDGSNFNLLHYVQQEESTIFLKQSEKGRMDELGKLFNTIESDDELQKISTVRKRVSKLIQELEEQLEASKQRKKSFSVESEGKKIEQITFIQLFNQLEYSWDKENYIFEDYKHVKEIIEELDELKTLVGHKNEFNIYKKNRQIMNLASREGLLKLLLVSPDILNKKEPIITIANEVIKNQRWLQSTDDSQKINWLLEEQYAYAFKYIESSLDSFKELQNSILENKKSINLNEKLLMSLQQARENLHGKHQQFIEDENQEQIPCPYCGEPYSTKSLEEAYQLAKELFKSNNVLSEKVLSLEKERSKEIKKIASEMEKFNEKHQGEVLLSKWMEEGKGVQEKLESSKNYLEKQEIMYSEYQIDETNIVSDGEKKLDILKNKIQALIIPLSDEVEEQMPKNKKVFSNLLKNNEDQLDELTIEKIESKQRHIEYSYYDNEKIRREKEYKLYKELYEKNSKMNKFKAKIDSIFNIYNLQKKNYLETLISKLEITLYIYTGKIIQNYPGGLGVFMSIESNGSYLKFLANYNDDIDIFSKLSTGQLSAFVISLVLAMNRKFSTKEFSLLLIDDPVQSMDELNVSAFVDLLRNEFSDYQVIVSTHEERISNFFKYKYRMSNLNTESLNVRKELNSK
ncbi:AAA family ATPase [Enterococcus plantarum]|uniref:AAA family ATPase n=1 Tax=Enterococcus plantarum TaxID=1077675 RepID=UPI001A907788|nr:AAA family ATPase [Enterococcus plantarum]MBO0422183.1 AAA family ATPase [Enterococcus plantarum]